MWVDQSAVSEWSLIQALQIEIKNGLEVVAIFCSEVGHSFLDHIDDRSGLKFLPEASAYPDIQYKVTLP